MIVGSDFGCLDNGWKLDLNLLVQVFDLGDSGMTV
jgi:hypothetical protein